MRRYLTDEIVDEIKGCALCKDKQVQFSCSRARIILVVHVHVPIDIFRYIQQQQIAHFRC